MTLATLIVGKLIGGSYVGRSAIIIKVTMHMHKIQLLPSGDQVCVMKWNVKKIPSVECNLLSSILEELEAMKPHIDFLLDQYRGLQEKKEG